MSAVRSNKANSFTALKCPVAQDLRSYVALLVLNALLGGEITSFLYRYLREDKRLCYFIESQVEPLLGRAYVLASVEREDYQSALKEINRGIDDLKAGRVMPEEWNRTLVLVGHRLAALRDDRDALQRMNIRSLASGFPITFGEMEYHLASLRLEEVVHCAYAHGPSGCIFSLWRSKRGQSKLSLQRHYCDKLYEELYTATLSGGFELWMMPKKGARQTVAQLSVASGVIHQMEGRYGVGVAHLLEHLLFENQRERSDSALLISGEISTRARVWKARNTCSPAAWVLKNVSLYCLSWFSMGVGRKIVWFAKEKLSPVRLGCMEMIRNGSGITLAFQRPMGTIL